MNEGGFEASNSKPSEKMTKKKEKKREAEAQREREMG